MPTIRVRLSIDGGSRESSQNACAVTGPRPTRAIAVRCHATRFADAVLPHSLPLIAPAWISMPVPIVNGWLPAETSTCHPSGVPNARPA